MTRAKWIGRAAAAAASGLVAMSSTASAQYGDTYYCEHYAMTICSHDERGFPQDPDVGCVLHYYAECMSLAARVEAEPPAQLARQSHAPAMGRPSRLR